MVLISDKTFQTESKETDMFKKSGIFGVKKEGFKKEKRKVLQKKDTFCCLWLLHAKSSDSNASGSQEECNFLQKVKPFCLASHLFRYLLGFQN